VIFFGWRVLYRPVGRGMFHCQRCGGDRSFHQLAGRRWFTLLFIPLIPLSLTGDHVRCDICGTRYRMGVLTLPTTAQMQVVLPIGMRAAAVTMLRAAGGGGEPARRRAIDAIRDAGADGYNAPALDADLSGSKAHPPGPDPARSLKALTLQLAPLARQWFLAAVVRIGLADGPLTDEEREAAHEIAAQLGISPAQARDVISVTEEGAPA
jgi:Tellurite resistance protein TerB